MDAVTTAQRMTAAEFLALPPLEHHHLRQLIDGEVVVNAPSWTHGDSLCVILTALRNWVRAGSARGGVNMPVDVLLDNYNVYEPDVVWYRDGRGWTIQSSRVKSRYMSTSSVSPSGELSR
jgi:Uma2 family endonuclease